MMTPRLVMLGGFRLHDAAGNAVPLSVRKAQALLAYLSMQPGRHCSRDRLAGLLWEGSSVARARQSLRQVLAELRKALRRDQGMIEIADEQIRLAPDRVTVDVQEFEQRLDEGTLEALSRAADLYQGAFLEGFNPRAPAFEDWLMTERSRLRERAVAGIQQLLDQELANRATADAVRYALRLVALDPLLESAHRALMELYARQGHYGAALRQYRLCQQKLRRELDVAPEAQTERLCREILRHRREGPKASAKAAAPRAESAASEGVDASGQETAGAPEPRQATMLLVRFTASEPDPERAHRVRQRSGAKAEAVVGGYGGQPLPGPGGDVLAVFGVPTAHSNDPERAVRAAVGVREALPDARIGLASGRIMVTGSARPSVTGAAVDRAADLATQGSAGEIRLSDTLYTSVAARVVAQRIAGGREAAWLLETLRDPDPDELPAFVGREREHCQCTAALEACRAMSCSQSLLVRGEAGIGKSRLLEECRALAEQLGFACHKVLVHNFGPGGEPVRALVCSLLGLAPDDGEGDTLAAAQQAVADGLVDAECQPELYDLLGLAAPKDLESVYKALDDATRRERHLRLVGNLVGICAGRQPRLLMVEDIHWADPVTLEHLARIAATVVDCPALLVMTHRVEGAALEPAWRGAMDGAPLTTIDLGPLRHDELQTLAAGLAADDSERTRRCIERAGGNPWFLEQLLQSDAADGSVIPDSVRSLVWARLDRLDSTDKRAAQAAAVLGQQFSLAALRHLLGDADYEAASLVAQRLVKPEGRDYRFRHDLIRGGVYESLPAASRRSLHERAAGWYRDRTPTLAARHLDWAGSREAPAAYLEAAREQSQTYRYEHARPLLERGLALAADPATQHELRRLRADVLHETGDIGAAIDAYREAADAAVDDTQRCHAWLGVAAGYGVKDQHQAALAALEKAEHLAGYSAAPLARLHILRGNLLFPLGRIRECLKSHQRARKYAREAGSPELEARALSGLGDAAYLHGRMGTAYGHFDRCVELARSQDLARVEASNLPMRGISRFYLNELHAAHQDATDAVASAAHIGHARAETLAREVVLTVLVHQGEWAAAEEQAEQGLALARRLGAQRFEADFLLDLGLTRLGQGREAEAETYLDQAYALSREAVLSYVGPWIFGALAVSTTDPEKRRWALEQGDTLLAAGSVVSHSHLHFCQHAIDAALAQSDWEAARHYCETLAAYTQREPLPWSEFFIARGRALADWRSGNRSPEVRQALEGLVHEAEQASLLAALPPLRAALAEA